MVGRDVEHLEVRQVVLDLRALVGDEPELVEDLRDLAHRLDAGMEVAAANGPAGRRHVHRFGDQPGGQLGAAHRGRALGKRRFDGRPHRVADRAHLRAIVGRESSDATEDRRQPALLAEHVELQRLERAGVSSALDRGERIRAQRLEIAGQVGEIHVGPCVRMVRPGITNPRSSLTSRARRRVAGRPNGKRAVRRPSRARRCGQRCRNRGWPDRPGSCDRSRPPPSSGH